MTEGITKDKDQHKTARKQTVKMLIICSLASVVVTGICGGIFTKGWGLFDNGRKKHFRTAAGSTEKAAPWLRDPLDSWSIVGMNHYHQNGNKYLFVAMVKDSRCIVEEGLDDETLWNRLCEKAVAEGGNK